MNSITLLSLTLFILVEFVCGLIYNYIFNWVSFTSIIILNITAVIQKIQFEKNVVKSLKFNSQHHVLLKNTVLV